MLNRLTEYIYNFKIGLQNLFIWFPVIWRDRDWDDSFMWKILNTKLRKMEQFFNRGDLMGVHSKKELKRLKEARILTDRIVADEYNIEQYDKIRDKYQVKNYSKYIPGEDHRRYCIEVNNGTEEEYRRELKRCLKHECYLRRQDIRRLGEILERYSFRWWD